MYSEIGTRLKKLRTSKNLTLKELSQLTNLSTGFLSQLERGITTVAIDSLDNIAKVLGVDITYFFQLSGEKQNDIVTKSYNRDIFFMDRDNFIQYHLSNNVKDKVICPRLIEIYPKKEKEELQVYSHQGEEFIFVLEGILTYYYNEIKYELYPGDSIHVFSTSPHNWENNTNNIVKILSVIVPNPLKKES
jgi:transcriptional regulator with XRE-family HTH domain